MLPQLVVVVAVLLAASAFGLWRRRQDGRIRGVDPTRGVPGHGDADGRERLTSTELGAELGSRATLVQFSTAFCQPCRATRRILADVAGQVDGVSHVEIDAESHLDLVRRLDIRRTPTVFVLDGSGAVVRRAVGQPRAADVVAAIGEAVP